MAWKQGAIAIPLGDGEYATYKYWIKYFDEPSEYGIDGGRISKLEITADDMVVCNYDRGWDIKPTTLHAKNALAILLHDYN